MRLKRLYVTLTSNLLIYFTTKFCLTVTQTHKCLLTLILTCKSQNQCCQSLYQGLDTHWPSILQYRPGPVWEGRKAACGRLPVAALPLNSAPALTVDRRWRRGRPARSQRRAPAGRPSETEAACCTEGQGQEQWRIYSLGILADVFVWSNVQ